MSSTPVQPAFTSRADVTPLRAGMPANTNPFLDVVGIALPGAGAGRLVGGVAERPAHLLRVEPGDTASGRCGSECARDAVGREADVVARLCVLAEHRQDDARADVVTERHGVEQRRAVTAQLFGRRECRWHDRAARMPTPGIVRVVGLIRMRCDTVGKRGLERRSSERSADDRGLALSCERADIALRRRAGWQPRTGQYGRERVDEMTFGLLRDLRRKCARARRAHVR